MRKQKIYMYSGKLDKEFEKEYELYKRDEFIQYIKDNNINLDDYILELYAPCPYKCSIENIMLLNEDEELFIFESDKEICVLL